MTTNELPKGSTETVIVKKFSPRRAAIILIALPILILIPQILSGDFPNPTPDSLTLLNIAGFFIGVALLCCICHLNCLTNPSIKSETEDEHIIAARRKFVTLYIALTAASFAFIHANIIIISSVITLAIATVYVIDSRTAPKLTPRIIISGIIFALAALVSAFANAYTITTLIS